MSLLFHRFGLAMALGAGERSKAVSSFKMDTVGPYAYGAHAAITESIERRCIARFVAVAGVACRSLVLELAIDVQRGIHDAESFVDNVSVAARAILRLRVR
jgi:hypothetical protein